jgi:co-chaperonin GroES (HSP10)
MNNSGIQPMEYNVLVLPKEVETKTKGGLILADQTVEKEKFGRMEGTLVAVSPLAFNFDDWPSDARKPQVGDRVLFSKYNATEIMGRDGAHYWIMKDRSIAGIMIDD